MTGCVSCVLQNGDQVVIPFYEHEDPAEVALQFGERYDLSAHAIRRLKDVINSNRERVSANAPLTATTRVPAAAQPPPSTSATSATSKSADSGSAAASRGRKAGDAAAQREGGGGQQVPRKAQRGRSPGNVGARPGSATRTRPDPFADQGAWHGASLPRMAAVFHALAVAYTSVSVSLCLCQVQAQRWTTLGSLCPARPPPPCSARPRSLPQAAAS